MNTNPAKTQTKPQRIAGKLRLKHGATMAELQQETGWQPHSVRAALSGLRKSGMSIIHEKVEKRGTVYRIAAA